MIKTTSSSITIDESANKAAPSYVNMMAASPSSVNSEELASGAKMPKGKSLKKRSSEESSSDKNGEEVDTEEPKKQVPKRRGTTR